MAQKTPLVLSGAQIQQLQAADYANIGIPFFMHKNRVLNGDFNIWQRGTSLNTITTTGTYYPDQWVYTFDGTTPSINVQQEAFTVGQTAVPDNPKYYCECSLSLTASSQTFLRMSQRIEGVQTFQGQSATISFWAKADTTRSLSVAINQNFGTGGSPSSTVATSGTTFSLTTSWAKYTFTFSVPSVSSKTLGTSGNDYLELVLGLPINSAFTIDIAHVQFEQGSNATQFEYRYTQHELLMCQRYFEAIVNGPGATFTPIAIGGWCHLTVSPTSVCNAFVPYSVKRATPTISTPDAAGNFFINCASGSQVCSSVSFPGNNSQNCGLIAAFPTTNFSGTQLGQAGVVQSNNTSTARVWVSAEL